MRKFAIYLFLVAAILVTGCSQKEMTVDQNKDANKQAASIDESLNNVTQKESVLEEIAYVADEVTDSGVYVTINGERVFLKSIYFAFNKFDISPTMREVIKENAALLSNYDGNFRVEGNADEWGTDEYNYALSLKRAKAVRDALITEGLSGEKIKLISYGESNPICLESNEVCWQKNRRAEFRLNQ